VIEGEDGCCCDRCLAAGVRCRTFDPVPVAKADKATATRPKGRPSPLVGAGDSTVQRAGAERAKLTVGTRRWEAYVLIRAAGPRGMTFDEMCGELGRSYSQTGPRVRELVRDGWVRQAGTRQASSGADQAVWVATAAWQGLTAEDSG
jgi:hypothetical protein